MNRGPPKNKISQWNGVEIVPRTMSLQEYLDQRLLGSDGTAFTNVKRNDEQENMVSPGTRSCPRNKCGQSFLPLEIPHLSV